MTDDDKKHTGGIGWADMLEGVAALPALAGRLEALVAEARTTLPGAPVPQALRNLGCAPSAARAHGNQQL